MSIDGDLDTKWLDYEKGPLLIKLPRATPVDAFGITTANDVPSRDPVQWTLRGSLDGKNWTLLHVQDTDYDIPQSRRAASPAIPLAPLLGASLGGAASPVPSFSLGAAAPNANHEPVTTTEMAVLADEPIRDLSDQEFGSGSLSTRDKIIGGAVGGSVGAVAVGLLGGLLGGLLTTEFPTTAMPNTWPSTTTTPAPQTSVIRVTFVSDPTTVPTRFLGNGRPSLPGSGSASSMSMGAAFQQHLGSLQPWSWAALVAGALAVAAAILAGFQVRVGQSFGNEEVPGERSLSLGQWFQAKGGQGGRGGLRRREAAANTRHATLEDSPPSSAETDEEQESCASSSLIRNEMAGANMTPAQRDAFDRIDANHDGVITRAEFEAARRFEMMDTNHDGVISRAEFEAAQHMQFGPPPGAYVPVASTPMQAMPYQMQVPLPVASFQLQPSMIAPMPAVPSFQALPIARAGSPPPRSNMMVCVNPTP
jgi:hypothetical protein